MQVYKEMWQVAVNAYNAQGGFYDKNYLDKYPREGNDKYKERQKVAYYENIFKQKVEKYVGYLFKQKPIRTSSSDLIKIIFDDVDKKGNAIDIFMSNFASMAKVRGTMLLLIDMPKEIPTTLKEQKEQRALPYFVPIEPERIIKYKIDKFGKFEWILYEDIIDNSTLDNEDIKKIQRYYDTTKWAIYEDDTIIEQGEHNLGVCPVLQFTESGEFPSVGEFTQIGDISKRLFNLNSELDEILRSQTFSILTIQARTPKDVEINIGTDNAISYGAEMNKPEFIAPPEAPAKTYQERIEKLEKRINEITYDIATTAAKESGIALQIKFQGLNSSLAKFAQKLNDLELRAFDIICRYLDIKNDIEITYPKDFNITDIMQEINVLESIKDLGYTLPTYEKQKLNSIIKNDLGSLGDDVIKQINSEIEDNLKEAMS